MQLTTNLAAVGEYIEDAPDVPAWAFGLGAFLILLLLLFLVSRINIDR